MNDSFQQRLRRALETATAELIAERNAQGFWAGELSSSALSTATAVTALAVAHKHGAFSQSEIQNPKSEIERGLRWLAEHQNSDGGWGDTTKSLSNISTTTLCWAAFGAAGADGKFPATVKLAKHWLTQHSVPPASRRVGASNDTSSAVPSDAAEPGGTPGALCRDALARAIIARYGKDRTFSVPILTMCALAGRLGEGRAAWRHVIPLPFELAACPHQLFAALRLPVVSYALPALIAIGQARHVHAPSRNPVARLVRKLTREKTLRVLTEIQPTNGGFLEATPLTSFVTMSLAGSGRADHVVTKRGLEFLLKSQRADGSWPIDTNLSTWCSTLSVNALGDLLGELAYGRRRFEQWPSLPSEQPALIQQHEAQVLTLIRWLLDQQYRTEHPYTHAAPGGWAWTNLPGGVPDADDTAGTLIALEHLMWWLSDPEELKAHGCEDLPAKVEAAARSAMRWLTQLQNRDGGIPTFCRGWGALPFDQSSPDLTAHALRAWRLWGNQATGELHDKIWNARHRAEEYLRRTQRADGSWLPLWFGNEHVAHDENPTYGTARVLLALTGGDEASRKALDWLRRHQNEDGSWGGGPGAQGSVEETGLAVEAISEHLVYMNRDERPGALVEAMMRGTIWLVEQIESGAWREPAPIGFYFAKLWYFERLYPMIFTVGALSSVTSGICRVHEDD